MTALNWGILATGWISNKFALDLLINPSTREAGCPHRIVAVASRDPAKATQFIKSTWAEAAEARGVEARENASEPLAGGDWDSLDPLQEEAVRALSYEQIYSDPQVTALYIGTPHSEHYRNCIDALNAGKHVLCEKPISVNAEQAKIIFALAKEKNLFVMEAVWTRFQPVSFKIQEIIASGRLGALKAASAELCIDMDPESLDQKKSRMVNLDLAGGALLDLGPYPFTMLSLALLPPTPLSGPSTIDSPPHPVPKLVASMIKSSSGADSSTIAVIEFKQENGETLHGTFNCSMTRRSARGGLIEFEKGTLEIGWAAYRPESLTITEFVSAAAMQNAEVPIVETLDFSKRPGGAWGFIWEADEAYRCLRDGRIQSERMPWRDTALMMEMFDEIRKQGGLVYPESIETTEK